MVRWQVTAVLGLMAAVAITGAALVAESDRIETEVAAAARGVLATEVTSWAEVAVDGREVVLTGAAPTEDLRQLAVDRVERVFGVSDVDASGAGLLPEAGPYSVTLTRSGGVLSIEGHAPSQPDRVRMVEALTKAVPGLAYNDRLTLARGMPDEGFIATLNALYPQLAEFSDGTIALVDRRVTIEGEAASNDAYGRLRHAAVALPDGYSVGKVAVSRPLATPFTWSAENTGRQVVLSGHAPDEATRLALYGVVRGGARTGPVIDGVDLASGAPDGFADVAAAAADFLDLFAFGRVDVRDTTVSIAGRATTPETYRTVNAYLATWKPAGFTVEAAVELPVVAPFALTASRSGDRVTVSGFSPSDEVTGLIKAAAVRIAGQKGAVIETTVAGGAPERFQDAALFGLGLLENLSEGTMTLSDKRLVLTGVAKSGSDLLEVEATASTSKPEGFDVQVDVTPPVVSPYVWSMEKTADSLNLIGSVPSEAVRTKIREIAEAAAGDLAVADRTSLAAGLPADVDLTRVATFAAAQIAHLTNGHVTLNDESLSIIGAAATAREGMAAVSAMEGRLPRAVKAGIVQVDFPPAFTMHIERGLDAITLQGTVADAAMRQAVVDTAARAFGQADLELTLDEMPGLPEKAQEAAVLAVRAASLLATGKVTIEGTVIQVQGKAFTGIGAVRLSSDIAADVPKGFRLETAVGVAKSGPKLPPDACERELTAVLSRNTILFEGDGAVVAEDSHGLLDRLGALASNCADTTFRIESQAAAGGDPATALALAQSRADAVRKFLADVGVDPAKIEAKGRGTENAAPNTTPDANRRIEMHAVPAAPAP